ncbi:MAG: alpha/beta fold hydrolase [Acidobacteriota bacterium]
MTKPWIAFHRPRPEARLRLFCLPYAGGGALVYRGWSELLPAEIEVCPVELPGRGGRIRETSHRRMAPLIDEMAVAVAPLTDKPWAVFGHSMGSVTGWELARRLMTLTHTEPVKMIASARRPPQSEPEKDPIHDLPDDELTEEIRALEGTPEEVLEHPELMKLMLPLLRADFELNFTYRPLAGPQLSRPLTALGGLEDRETTNEILEGWREATTGPFKLRMLPGGHFFVHDDLTPMVVAEELLR